MRKFTSTFIAGLATVGLLLTPSLPAHASDKAPNSDTPTSVVTAVGKNGQGQLSFLNPPAEGKYKVGDEIQVKIRFESSIEENQDVTVSSEKVSHVSGCGWKNLPAKSKGGRYTCQQGAQNYTGQPIYKVTSEDQERGNAQVTVTFTAQVEGKPVDNLTVTKTVPVFGKNETQGLQESHPVSQLAVADAAGYKCHRIPALAKVNGRLIAAWDGRPNGCGDAPNPNSIIMKYSDNDGETWSDFQTIAQGQTGKEKFGYSDPSFVVDEETGTIFAFFVKSFDQGIAGSVSGSDASNRSIIHTVYVKSSDRGNTWSEPKLVTAEISAGQDQYARFAASGQGIQLKYGPHKGRLIQQYTVVNGGNWGKGKHQAASLYSDDHGNTWKVGTPIGGEPGAQMDENKVVELSDGRVLLSSRVYEQATGGRHYAISKDGGVTYELDPSNDLRLKDPRNNASILRAFPDAEQGSALAKILFSSHANNTTRRVDGVVSYSLDDGKTWKDGAYFKKGQMQYSTMTPLGAGKYGILFEGESSTINYKKVDLNWISPELASYVETVKLKDANRELEESNKQLEAEKIRLQEQLDKAKQEAEKARADQKAAEEAKAKAEAKVKQLEAENAELKKQLNEAKKTPKADVPMVPLTPAQPIEKPDLQPKSEVTKPAKGESKEALAKTGFEGFALATLASSMILGGAVIIRRKKA
ncbi:exo-alpha-sialidase [Arcanobacterium canis]